MKDFQAEDQILFEAIEAYKNGNGDKATIIYESTKKYTFKILHKGVERYKNQGALTGDVVSIAEDIMQELYIEFFNKIANFRNEDPKSIFKWISVVAQRRLSTYVKENGTEVLQFEKNEDYREESDIWDSSEINDSDMEGHHELLPEAALEDKEFRELIMGFVQSLPEAQAQTVLLHFRGGMKYQEIADEMGVSLITVKTRMKKAKDSLEEIITKYEKKTGTKLHSVSILPLLWLLYRMSSESTTVPVAVDTAVTGSLAGASGTAVGSVATAGVTKAISTKVLIGIISATVVIGGVAVGSQIVDKKQETAVEQSESEDEELDNKQDNEGDTPSKEDTDTSNTNGEPTDSSTNQQNQDGGNNGDNTNEDNNVTQEGNGVGNNTSGNVSSSNDSNSGGGNTSSNEGDGGNGDTSGNDSTGGSEDNSGNEDTGETTKANGSQENPYRIGDKITISNVTNVNSRDTSTYDIELTIMEYTVPKLENAVHVSFSNSEMILNIIKSKIKVTRDSSEAYGEVPLIFDLLSEDGKVYGQSGYLHKQDGNIITSISNNAEYDIGFHMTASSFNGESTYTYFRITYLNENRTYSYIYFKL